MTKAQLQAKVAELGPDEPAALGTGGNGAEGVVQQTTAPSVDEPWGVADSRTPSGLEIHYEAGPKRLYRIRQSLIWDEPEQPQPSEGEWQEVPSVSTILDCLEKGGLSWWGMKVGIAGTLQLMNVIPFELKGKHIENLDEVEPIVQLLKEKKLTVNHVRDKAADRGTSVHASIESWAQSGVTPDPSLFPENERGYVQAFVAFLNDAHPHPVYSELMVGSMKGFAGRFDLLASLDFADEVVIRRYPQRKPKRKQLSGSWLIDAKSKSPTAKGVYKQHKIQVAGYELALIEDGYPKPEHKGVLNLWPDGTYELVESKATGDDFLAILGAYRVVEGIE